MKAQLDHKLGYFILRLALGINILTHGLVRLPHLDEFASTMVSSFENTFLPLPMVEGFAYVLPFLETIIGALIIVGLFSRQVLFLGGLLMAFLIFGTCLEQDWAVASRQMVYILFYYFLLVNREEYNYFSLDELKEDE